MFDTNKDNACFPKLYLRYVDDVFAVFHDNTSHLLFLDSLNLLHPNLKFTIEISTETLPFLDVELKIEGDHFNTWVYRKKTHTNVLLNFFALSTKRWKTGLIYCLLHRAKTICTNINLFNNEVTKLREMFSKNSYPARFLILF